MFSQQLALSIFSAGSLRTTITQIKSQLEQLSQRPITFTFGPAGLLSKKIQSGIRCDLFLSANMVHPQHLHSMTTMKKIMPFCHNSLCLTIARRHYQPHKTWLDYVSDPTLLLATSTPNCDPSGDYTWQLFDKIAQHNKPLSDHLKKTAQPLVGGINTLTIPIGYTAASFLIQHHNVDMFIGYSHYQSILARDPELMVIPIPAQDNIYATYGLAYNDDIALPIVNYLLSTSGQHYLQQAGFSSVHQTME
ncbi:solute-binding protein [Photobacterium carnosum]|uniref:Molybdate ABC transporter substrate-binding protein n=1 Tax=Photobacterium iliopiscarium TaxID=56192 RepID=A0A2T3M7U0_9GAMM|nr:MULTISPECIES: substrate-binding domain-containing protein [Photobacterium]MBY3790035.1 solute-binding protein [Photobacterium carnosum]MCD9524145.1 molybdate ABC transporter substrate-binding protein [Photobacterium carnosum]MCD9535737.1 molybdate ABC transporter substrate-binding protein [Photobacterium carnosum]PSV88308.1 molybdate ABC transporter substrate-binding protein [Photobacterium iliopiscarium]